MAMLICRCEILVTPMFPSLSRLRKAAQVGNRNEKAFHLMSFLPDRRKKLPKRGVSRSRT